MERTFVIRAGQPCCLLIPVVLCGIVGPSYLGECALVQCCSEGTFIGLVGMDCNVMGPKKVVLGTFLFLKKKKSTAISFCRFSNFTKSEFT